MATLGVRRVSRRAVAALTIAIAIVATSDAIGKTRNRLALQSLDAAAPALPEATAPVLPPPAPSQYFTINEILKKRAEPVVPRGPVRLASVDPLGLRGSISAARFGEHRVRGGDAPFGLVTFRAPEGLLWVKWRKVQKAVNEEAELISRCRAEPDRCPTAEARRFVATVEDIASTRGRARLETANRVINATIRYTSDLAQHGEPDVWSSPLATFASGRGDCEDYAIAKYVALREAGVPDEDLKVLLAIDRSAGEPHAVLAARHEGAWFILDNRRPRIAEDREIGYFTPLFVLDQQGVKLLSRQYQAAAGVRNVPSRAPPIPGGVEAGMGSPDQATPAGSGALITVPDDRP